MSEAAASWKVVQECKGIGSKALWGTGHRVSSSAGLDMGSSLDLGFNGCRGDAEGGTGEELCRTWDRQGISISIRDRWVARTQGWGNPGGHARPSAVGPGCCAVMQCASEKAPRMLGQWGVSTAPERQGRVLAVRIEAISVQSSPVPLVICRASG